MATIRSLFHVNGGPYHGDSGDETSVVECANCSALVAGNYKVSHKTGIGMKYFCKQEPDAKPEESCYNQWKRRRN